MSYSVIWSEQAEKDFSSILDYLLENWGTVSAQKFQTKINKQIQLISNFPKMYSVTTFFI
jgi:plasmid stabilization system protein ParE